MKESVRLGALFSLFLMLPMNAVFGQSAIAVGSKDYPSQRKPEFSLKVYANTTHAFDFETFPVGGVNSPGHHVEYDREATSDAITLTRDFLAKYVIKK